MLTLGGAIKRLRQVAGLTQRALAAQLDIDPSYLSHLEANRREPSVQLLRQIAGALSVPSGFLLALTLWVDLPPTDRATYQPIIDKLMAIATAGQLRLDLDAGSSVS